MSQSSQSVPSIGFYSVEYSESLGWIGGYLILNATGRPLEFHCTLPIRPSRTHEILYGASLKQYLVGDAIPAALMKQSKNRPLLFCTDQASALSLSDTFGFPVALVVEDSESNDRKSLCEGIATKLFKTPQGVFRGEGRFESAIQSVLEKLSELPDLAEPFARIREAIREAQQQGVPQQVSQQPGITQPGLGNRVA